MQAESCEKIMGSSYAYPILETSDVGEVFRTAQRLLALSEDRHYTVVEGRARATTKDEVERLAAAVPDSSCYLSEEPPLTLEVPEETRAGTFEEEFVQAAQGVAAWLRWDVGAWPAGPFGYRDTEYSGVQLALNSRELSFEPPPMGAGQHMLYVCVGKSDRERAQWLAEQVGLHVLGEPVQSL
ncbi:hypothetical protein [Streptomyces sp. NPDC003036]|uniref:hypothetical protein n=1 Tax=Streptomyces sp. NPDC003036 TaxID=3154442 RepID=UPI0033A625D7